MIFTDLELIVSNINSKLLDYDLSNEIRIQFLKLALDGFNIKIMIGDTIIFCIEQLSLAKQSDNELVENLKNAISQKMYAFKALQNSLYDFSQLTK